MQVFSIKILTLGIISFLTAATALYFLIPYLIRKSFLDVPNARSSHKKTTPRGGGLAIAIGITTGSFVAYFLEVPLPHYSFFAGFLMMATVSFLDDKKNLPPGLRLAVHMLAMGWVIYETGGLKQLPFPPPLNIELEWFGYIVSGIWIIAVINFFNFLDGIDGYAGTQALLAGLAIMSIQWGGAVGTMGCCVASASLGFLLYNWHPAKIFMGDVGSVSLGFTFATLPFYSTNQAPEPLVYSIALFLWFFLSDGAFTLLKRMLNKEKVWEPHRTHLYQRLNQAGWPPPLIVAFTLGLGTLLSLVQVYFFKAHTPFNWWSVGMGLAFFLIFLLVVLYKENQKKRKSV
jgi:Fuc2NAc and GlcNAc transferase